MRNKINDAITNTKAFDDLIDRLKVAPLQPIVYEKEDNKHLKGYIFDSLVYRYMMARDKQMEYENIIDKQEGKYNPNARSKQANRDKMRFIEILDEAIGEHD